MKALKTWMWSTQQQMVIDDVFFALSDWFSLFKQFTIESHTYHHKTSYPRPTNTNLKPIPILFINKFTFEQEELSLKCH